VTHGIIKKNEGVGSKGKISNNFPKWEPLTVFRSFDEILFNVEKKKKEM
jgi:hypothetical protein